MLVRTLVAPFTAVLLAVVLAGPPAVHAVTYDDPPEDYASYQPQTKCRKTARPGTVELAAWVNRTFKGGTATASVRACGSGGASAPV